jgi:hypothetical protein
VETSVGQVVEQVEARFRAPTPTPFPFGGPIGDFQPVFSAHGIALELCLVSLLTHRERNTIAVP